jgi:putative ABC transport system permease protein
VSHRPAIAAIARWEWQRRWRSLVALGLIGGVFGGLLVAGAVMTRRTLTAPDRLVAAVAPGDVHVQLFGRTDVADRVASVPSVELSWSGGVAVGRLEGGGSVQFVGLLAPTSEPVDLLRPVVVAGRAARPTAPDEVVLDESAVAGGVFGVGDRVRLAMLSAAEVFQFDTGFGEPDGPTLDLLITGVVRVPPGLFDGTPLIATPAFTRAHAELFAGADLFVALRGGASALPRFEAEANEVLAPGAAPGVEDFPPLSTTPTMTGTDALLHSSRVLFGGLIAALMLGALAVVAALGQAWSRHHGMAAMAQRVESSLGLTTSGRVAARLLPAAAAASIAGVVAGVIGATGSWVQPVGGLGRVEPTWGWRFDPVVVVAGAVVVALVIMLLAGVTAWRAGREPDRPVGELRRSMWRLVPRRGGWTLAGATFALSSGGSRRHVPVRMSLIGGILGIAGIVGSSTFGASLDRLVTTPERYGWNIDFAIADVTDEIIAEVAADHRFEAVVEAANSQVLLNGGTVDAYSMTPRVGRAPWTMLRGRMPEGDDEVTLGPKLAERLDVSIGDVVDAGTGGATRVVGIGIGPDLNGETLGSAALFSPAGLAASAVSGAFREALVTVKGDEDRDAVIGELAARWEVTPHRLPAAVHDISELGSLPGILGTFLAALAAVALAHALVVTGRQRASDLAVLRAIGATPRQAGMAVVTMAVATVVFGLVFGFPLGWALARLLWGELAESIGVQGDVLLSIRAVVALTAALIVAVLLAILPARRAARAQPAQVLRTD